MNIKDWQNLHESNSWVNVQKLKLEDIPDETTCINVDTRDFAITCSFRPITADYYDKNSGNSKQNFRAYPLLIDPKIKPEFLITKEQVIDFLKMLDEISKDEDDSDWRFLDFDLPNCHYNGWDFKYLRIFKHTKINAFVVCTDTLKAVHWQDLNSKTLKKQF